MTHTELMALADAYAYAALNVKDTAGRSMNARTALSDALKQVVQDAEKYNWIRLTSAGTDFVVEELQDTPPSTWNEAIDAAMQEKP
jgi:hypothetical protein